MTQRTPSKTAFSLALFLWHLCACAVFLCLFFVSAPYGRFYTPKAKSSLWWGPAVDGRIGWTVQELASPIALLSFYHCRDEAWLFSFPNATNTTNNGGTVLVLSWFFVHYMHRAVVWPWRRTMGKTNFPVVGSAILFNFFNGKFIASELRAIGGIRRSQDDVLFKLGLVLAVFGALVNVVSDEILLRRRRANTRATPSRAAARRHSVVSTNKSSKYILPNGFFFDYVLCPNYLGEFIEWLGLAVATNNLALRAFALWTFANLFPRAVNYRRWYVDTFGEKAVGKHRKAFLPFLV